MSDNEISVTGVADVCVIVCVFGREVLTRQVLHDLRGSGSGLDIWIVDNRGDFQAPYGTDVNVMRPGKNLGWARGSNAALSHLLSEPYSAFVLLNNDVRLSPDFIRGLTAAREATGAALLSPVYDHNWPHQRVSFNGQPGEYSARPAERKVPFIDGTCMFIPRETIEAVGLLDADFCPRWGWASDKDYSLRVRGHGGSVFVTERSYLAHLARGTASMMEGFTEESAERENDSAMAAKWGANWLDKLYEGFPDLSRIGLTQASLRDEV